MRPVWKALVGASIALSAFSAWGNPQGRVSLTQAGFISPDYSQTLKKDYQFIGAGLDTLAEARQENEIDDSLQVQIRGMIAPGAPVMNYLNVSQLFWKQDVLSLGRKKIAWNYLDEDYSLGIYQPLFKWNPLQWESQGLTGLFLHLETVAPIPWGMTLFASPLFIPNQGAGYEVQDGVFIASNPYFKAPPTLAYVNEGEFRINYNIQKPSAEDVVMRQSFAGRLFVGAPQKGAFAQISYAYKPMNELNLGFIGYAPAVRQQVNVEIQPVVSNHSVLSADFHYVFENFRAGISAARETPQTPEFSKEWTYTNFTNSSLVSPFVEFRDKQLELKASLLTIEGAESIGSGPEAHQANKFIPQRYPFRNAAQLSARYQYRLKRFENLALQTRYLRGESGEFDLWLTQASYQWRQGWAFNVVSQMVAVESSEKGLKTAYNSYLDNDLLAMGVSYVF